MNMTSSTFDPTKPVIWKLNAAQILTIAGVLISGAFTAGVTWAGVWFMFSSIGTHMTAIESRVTALESQVSDIDKNGPQFAARNNFVGRLSSLETNLTGIAQNGTADTRMLERRVTATEASMNQLVPAVKEIQVNVQWMMKQQGGK